MSDAQSTGSNGAGEATPIRLRDALRKARIEAADRTGVVGDLRDAEVARLEILNEALDPLFVQSAGADRFVRSRHQPGRDAAAVDRRGGACRDGARQAHISFRAGHAFRPHRARRVPRCECHRQGGDRLRRAADGGARARAGGAGIRGGGAAQQAAPGGVASGCSCSASSSAHSRCLAPRYMPA